MPRKIAGLLHDRIARSSRRIIPEHFNGTLARVKTHSADFHSASVFVSFADLILEITTLQVAIKALKTRNLCVVRHSFPLLGIRVNQRAMIRLECSPIGCTPKAMRQH